MKKIIKPAAIIFFLITLSILAMFRIYLTGPIMLPADLTSPAQSEEAFFAQITAEMNLIDVELTRMASEPELTSIPTPSINSQDWLELFLHNPTCQIPCWENISPNKTDINTATKIVSRIPGVRIVTSTNKEIAWYFDDNSHNIGYIIANQEGIVLQIYLWSRDGKALYLKDVIESYGTPVAILEGMDCNHILSYRYQGMLLSTTDTSCSRKPTKNITPTTLIDRFILFSPDNQDYTLDIFAFNMDEILWDGYKTYDFTNK